MTTLRRAGATTFLLASLLLAACGDDNPDAASQPTDASPTPTSAAATTATTAGSDSASAFPMTIKAANGDVEIAAKPTKIVSLSPTATEMLFAIGAGDQVTAVDDQSNYPAEAAAKATKLSGFEPNVEAIAGYEPDLVVIADDTNGLTSALGKLGITVLSEPAAATLDDTYSQIEQLGAATDHVGDAAALVAQMQTDIAAIVKSVPAREVPLRYYHELDQTYFSATSKTFIGQVYSLLGLKNIADPADADGSGYPQLSAEAIIAANPELIFLADTKCCQQTPATVAARPGWNVITAVKEGGVVPLDDDVASRWGPRIVDYLRTVADAVNQVGQKVG
jgi:iron complex transport system substrate-binding protein